MESEISKILHTNYPVAIIRHSIVILSALAFFLLHLKVIPSLIENLPLVGPPYYLQSVRRYTYAVHCKDNLTCVNHVKSVLYRLGYVQTHFHNEWDLLWTYDNPFFTMADTFKEVKPHQVVNYFPGIEHVTNKENLSNTQLPFVPRIFRLPLQKDEFVKYALDNPAKKFIEKRDQHGMAVIKPPGKIDLDGNNTYIQEYIHNPFLLDGHKFDIGVYVVLTSVDPLRVYIYTGDVQFRYCSEKYYPFNAKNPDKYTVSRYNLPAWERGVKIFNKLKGSMKNAFNVHVQDQGKDPREIWKQIEQIIRETMQSKEMLIAAALKLYKTRTRNVFHLMRFDFIIDESMRVYLMEVSTSSSLSEFGPHSMLYDQILYSVLNLVGIGPSAVNSAIALGGAENMITSDRNIATLLDRCGDFDCDESCKSHECELCLSCMNTSDYQILRDAYWEHMHRMNMRRVVPKPIEDYTSYNLTRETKPMSRKNRLLTRWFYGKCLEDVTWCN